MDLCYVGYEHNKLLQPTAFAPVVFSAFSTDVFTSLNTAQDLGLLFNAFFRAIVLHAFITIASRERAKIKTGFEGKLLHLKAKPKGKSCFTVCHIYIETVLILILVMFVNILVIYNMS